MQTVTGPDPSKSLSLEPEQVSAAEAARLAGVSEASWWRFHAAGKVPRPNRLGHRTLWQVNGPNGLREFIRRDARRGRNLRCARLRRILRSDQKPATSRLAGQRRR